MGGPIAHGVLQGMRRERKQPTPPASTGTAWVYFVIVTVSLSWLTVAVMGGPSLHPGWLVAALAWQPVVGALVARLAGGQRAHLGWLGVPRHLAVKRWGRGPGHALHAVAWLAWWGPILAYAAGWFSG